MWWLKIHSGFVLVKHHKNILNIPKLIKNLQIKMKFDLFFYACLQKKHIFIEFLLSNVTF